MPDTRHPATVPAEGSATDTGREGGSAAALSLAAAAATTALASSTSVAATAVGDEGGVISDSDLNVFLLYSIYLTAATLVLGVFFSVLNISVFHAQQGHRGKPLRVRKPVGLVYLRAICWADTIYFLCKTVDTLGYMVCPCKTQVNAYLQLFFGTYLAVSSRRTAIIVNALASVDRCLVIAFPLNTASSLLKRRPYLIIAIAGFLTYIFHAYFFLEFQVIASAQPSSSLSASTASIAGEVLAPRSESTALMTTTNTNSFQAASRMSAAGNETTSLSFEDTATTTLSSCPPTQEIPVASLAGDRLQSLEYFLGRTAFGATHASTLQMYKHVVRAAFFFLPLLTSPVFNVALMVVLRWHAQSKQGLRFAAGVASPPSEGFTVNSTTVERSGEQALAVRKEEEVTAKSPTDKNISVVRKTMVSGLPPRAKASSSEVRAGKYVLLVTLIFFLAALPTTLTYTVGMFLPVLGTGGRDQNLRELLVNAFDLLPSLAQVTIFLVSVLVNRHFRETAIELLSRRVACRCRMSCPSVSKAFRC